MFLIIKSFEELDGRRLMDLYSEGNIENAEELYPDEDRAQAVRKVEESFLDFLKNKFFAAEGSEYFILVENGEWVSALRTSRIRDELYYMEALETRPDMRQRSFAKKLLLEVLGELKKRGRFELYCCVSKKNEPSIRTHLAAGFAIVSENGYSYLQNSTNERTYGLGYVYRG
ncbi:MAG: GNAT family N-acetyltransferase [Clostridia bacterium]|nr:GNAT family N-acetyltransferase [Clostridia bacterium]